MAGTTIGPLTLKMVANADGMSATLGKMSNYLSSWSGAQVKKISALSKATSGIPGLAKGGLIGSLAAAAGDAFENPLRLANNALLGGAASMLEMAPVIGGAIALPLRAIQGGLNTGLDLYDGATKRITEIGKGAARTGMSAEAFSTFAVWAEGADKAEKSMFKFGQSLAKAQFAAVGTRTMWDDLGIDGKRLADVYATDATAAIGMVGDRLRALGHPALQAHAAMELFGKSGKDLLPSLLRGSAGIEEVKANMAKFGLHVTGGLVSSVREAGKAAKQVKMLWDGLSNQIVIAVAPIVTVVSEMIGKMPKGFAGLGDGILDSLYEVAKFGAGLWDDWGNEWSSLWASFKGYANLAFVEVADAFEKVVGARWHNSLIGKSLGVLDKASGAALARGALGAALGVGGDTSRDDAMKMIAEAAKKREEARKALQEAGGGRAMKGLESLWKQIQEKKNGIAADTSGIDLFAPMLKRANELKDGIKGPLDNWRNGLLEVMTVTQALGREQAKMNAIAANNKAMDALGVQGPQLPVADLSKIFTLRQQGLAAFKALSGLMTGAPEKRFAGAAERDSTEAYSAIVQHQFGDQNKSLQERILEAINEQKAVQETQARAGLDLLDFVKNNPGVLVDM